MKRYDSSKRHKVEQNVKKASAPKEEGIGTQKERKGDTKETDNPKSWKRRDEDTDKKATLENRREGGRPKPNVTSIVNCPLQPEHETPPNTSSQRMNQSYMPPVVLFGKALEKSYSKHCFV